MNGLLRNNHGVSMISRRNFVRAGVVAGAAAVAPRLVSASTATGTRDAALRILILGGTGFVGPHLVNDAVTRGHSVAILTRGRREPTLFETAFERVEHLIGDRAEPDGLNALKGRTWDVVIETSGYRHAWTQDAVRALAGSTGHYVYISSTGVFWPYRTVDIAEDGPIALTDDPPRELPTYGVMKALSERAVHDAFGARALIVRPGYIVGPGDTSDRWTYWPVRIARGGNILVPGRRTDRVQYIDVRDLTSWMVALIESGTGGTFNAVGPARSQTLEEFVHGVAAITPVPLRWTWIEDYDWLKRFPLQRLQDGTTQGLTAVVPWIMAEGDELGHMRIDGSRALAAGLSLRALADTARDTLLWRQSDQVPGALRERPRYVLSEEQERAILEAWSGR
jgi:2'-hydroxyisoflavone reductase